MTLRKNQYRIKVPTDAKVQAVYWDDTIPKLWVELKQIELKEFKKLKAQRKTCVGMPRFYTRLNDEYIAISPRAPYQSLLTVHYQIYGMI